MKGRSGVVAFFAWAAVLAVVGACAEPRQEGGGAPVAPARGEVDAGAAPNLQTECATVAAAIDKAPGITKEQAGDAAASRTIFREDARMIRASSPRDRRLADAVTAASGIFDSLAEHADQSAADYIALTKANDEYTKQVQATFTTLSELMSGCISEKRPKDCETVLAVTKKFYPAEKAVDAELVSQMQRLVAELEATKPKSSDVKRRIAKVHTDVDALAVRREASKRADEALERVSMTSERREVWARLHEICPNIAAL